MTEANKTAQPLVFGSTEGLGRTLLPEREGQAEVMTLTGSLTALEECGHWYSPAAVRTMLASERASSVVLLEQSRADFATMRELAHNGAAEFGRLVGENARLRGSVQEQRLTIEALMVGMPDDGTTPVIRRIAALEHVANQYRSALAHVLPLAEQEWAHHESLSSMGTTVGLEALRVIRAALTVSPLATTRGET